LTLRTTSGDTTRTKEGNDNDKGGDGGDGERGKEHRKQKTRRAHNKTKQKKRSVEQRDQPCLNDASSTHCVCGPAQRTSVITKATFDEQAMYFIISTCPFVQNCPTQCLHGHVKQHNRELPVCTPARASTSSE